MVTASLERINPWTLYTLLCTSTSCASFIEFACSDIRETVDSVHTRTRN